MCDRVVSLHSYWNVTYRLFINAQLNRSIDYWLLCELYRCHRQVRYTRVQFVSWTISRGCTTVTASRTSSTWRTSRPRHVSNDAITIASIVTSACWHKW